MRDLTSPGLPAALSEPFSLMEYAFLRLTRLVGDMTPAQLEALGPAGNHNSTATLLGHLARIDLEYLHIIMGQAVPPDLEAEYGPVRTADDLLTPVTGKTATELLAHYRKVIDMARAYLSSQSDADATRAVNVPWWPEPASVRYVLWHMAGHSMFHQGHITKLKQYA